jgi:hypothetical protein
MQLYAAAGVCCLAAGGSSCCLVVWQALPLPSHVYTAHQLPRHNTAVHMENPLVAGVYGCCQVHTCSSGATDTEREGEGYTVCLAGLTTSPAAFQHKVGYTRMGHWCCTPCSHSHCHRPKLQAPRAAAAPAACAPSTGCTSHHPQWGPCNEGVHTSRTVADGYQIGLKVLTCKGHVSARLGGTGERSRRARSPCIL